MIGRVTDELILTGTDGELVCFEAATDFAVDGIEYSHARRGVNSARPMFQVIDDLRGHRPGRRCGWCDDREW